MATEETKKATREFFLGSGENAVGFAGVEDHKYDKTPTLTDFMPKTQSMAVLGYREPDRALNGPIAGISMASRPALTDMYKQNNLIVAKFTGN